MSKKSDDSKDKKIAMLEAQLKQLEQVREDQVEELLSKLQTAMSDIADLLVRCKGFQIEAGHDD